jgi:hypothetical protein
MTKMINLERMRVGNKESGWNKNEADGRRGVVKERKPL